MNNILNTLFIMKAKYYLLTIILAFSLLSLNAQKGAIIHHVPDTCHEFTGPYGEIAAFDIDGNGSNDIAFQSFQGDMHSTWLNAVVFADWQMTMEDPAFPYPDSVQLDTLQYWDVNVSTFIPIINPGAPSYITKKICLRRKVGDDHYYAWVKTDSGWSNNRRVYACVEEFAYCSIPNYPLRWGQTDLNESIEEKGSTAFATVHPNPTNGLVTIAGENLRQAEVVNVLGQQILCVQGKDNELHIDMTALPAGIYFVTVTDEEGRKCMHKVLKE